MRRSLNELLAFANQVLPDNNQGLIEPADVRTMFTDFLDTLQPTYGSLSMTSQQQTLNTNPAVILAFQRTDISIPPEFICSPAAGSIKRELAGVPKLNTRFTINGNYIGPQGHDITITLFANGVATPWQQSTTAQGTANYATFAFTALDRIDEDTTYELRARSSNNGSVITWENFIFLGENIPIRDFTISAQAGIQLRGALPVPVPVPSTLDLDGDGKMDTFLLALPNGGMMTVDEDSVNIDSTGDGVADVVIPR